MRKFRVLISSAFSFLANADGFISFFERIFANKDKPSNMNLDTHLIFQITSIILTFTVAYYFLGKIEKLHDKLKLSLIISQIRDIVTFDERYGHIRPALLPDETIESFLNRTPESKYQRRLQNEITEERQMAINTFKDLKVREIDKMITDCYELSNVDDTKN